MKWITYQINEFSNKLHPNSPFRLPGFNLDPWQKDTIKAINDKKNILLSLPTSAGKTILSTYTFKAWSKVIFCSPNEAPSYQLTGITLASLDDMNDSTKNVRQETNNFTFKKYPAQPDNIIISTPVELYNMILNKSVDLNVDYIIFDEFHNVTDEILGPYIEFIFKTASYYNIPIMALSATIPNFLEVKTWMEKLTKKDIFGIYEKKRFFNQKRFYIKDGKLNQINPLEHITKETLMDPTFTQIGLYPKEIISLRDNVQKLKHNDNLVTDESVPDMLTLDKLHILEGKIFEHLKNSPEIHDQIFDTNKTDLIPENITIYGLFKIMKECKDKKMLPLLAFKFDSQHCLDIYNSMIEMLKVMEKLVYPGFNAVNDIIQTYFDTLEKETKNLEVDKDKDRKKGKGKSKEDDDTDLGNKDIEDLKDDLKNSLFNSPTGVKYKLERFYNNFVSDPIDPKSIELFNTSYGANFTEEYIIEMRKKHVEKEMAMYSNPDNLRLRNVHNAHQECRLIDSSVPYEDMRKIRRNINSEITRDTKIKLGVNAQVQRIDYDHPFMVGIKYGVICCNKLMQSAFQRVCQQLINAHPFVTLSDESLKEGINYPIKTVMLLGKDNEKLNNTKAHQACGRAGRRGLDSEGYIIYAGVDISSILIPKYIIVNPNTKKSMSDLIPDQSYYSEEFKKYVLDEIIPETPEKLWEFNYEIDIDKIAEELFKSQVSKEISFNNDDGENTFTVGNETLEQIKAKLASKYLFKKSTSSDEINVNINYNSDLIVETSESNQEVVFEYEVVDDWETAANDYDKELKSKIISAEESFM
jgi:hypothetical protein